MSALGLKMAALALLPRSIRSHLMRQRFEREVSTTGEAEMPYLGLMLKQGDLALDVGCNLGSYAFALGKATGQVIAFEPNPNMAKFVRSLDLAGVRIEELAASNTDGTAELHIPQVRSGHALATLNDAAPGLDNGPQKEVTVRTVRLDSMSFPSAVKFIKIDVEGHEEAALQGSEKLLEAHHPYLLVEIEERYNPGGLDRILKYLEPFGYEGFFLHDRTWHNVSDFRVQTHQDAGATQDAHRRPRRELRYVNNFLFMTGERDASLHYLSSLQLG